ncbi:P2R1A-PPP2R2A-interacting phosphatase regulator 1 [Hylaeus anthracinus]|uniref:P2R1A-PPP2R2A-interacting phosphatase regulator 1 n=1 Tax=Hylaeus volcanicus TaxID=313075 RepID=UPI0023B7B94D|nr:P2R1A-PPP2R2A-interacting phosphatase regulator 1 [Hylaeus volcanicus]XP_054006326.1 P2R1A-PPP2R2A-interacting phosphatase regulator 1 [Hylaeus anthracinus]
MDVDCTIVSLKRSSSAPMINKISATMSVTSPSATAPREVPSNFNIFSNSPRTRRFSTSSSGTVPRLTPRVSQLRQEECIDVAGREAAHEKEIHSAMQISQSWEDLTIEAEGLSFKDSESASLQFKIESRPLAKRVLDPLSINLSVSGQTTYSSPSPTRSNIGQRQCYSPGVHAVAWKSNLSPSPTRKAFATRRSLSPIAIRPSCLASVKRKCELDDSGMDHQLQPPTKRTSGLLTSATSRLDVAISSLHPAITSVGTPESCSSLDSPGFSFRPVDSPSPGPGIASIVSDDPSSSSSSSSSSSISFSSSPSTSSSFSSSITSFTEGSGAQVKTFEEIQNEQTTRENHG